MKNGTVLVAKATIDASSTNITTTYQQLTLLDGKGNAITGNLLPKAIQKLILAASVGNVIDVAVGASGSQASIALVSNYSGSVEAVASESSAVWVKSASGTVSTGIFSFSFYA